MRASISLHHLFFTWPDGSVLFDGLDTSIGPGRHGIVGRNGSGKSTLIRLIAGHLSPDAGTVHHEGTVGYLPQVPEFRRDDTIGHLLGVAPVLEALTRVEAGSVDPADFDLIGSDWDLPERLRAELARLGLGEIELSRLASDVSGGELVLLTLTRLLLLRPNILLLDEPTNSLDREARDRLMDVLTQWRGTLVVVSHDREMLAHMDTIGELRDGELSWYGGNFAAYESAVAVEQEAAERAVRAAESQLKTEQRDLMESQIKLARRERTGRKVQESRSLPKILVGARKRSAQVSAGKLKGTHDDRREVANSRLAEAEARVRDDEQIRIDLPATRLPQGRGVLLLDNVRPRHADYAINLEIRGPERIGLTGPNGIGKTSLLKTIVSEQSPATGEVRVSVPARYVPQDRDLLRPELSVAENLAVMAPAASEIERRALLARFLFRGHSANQLAGSLSGGERLRATLASVLLAEPAPQLLLLDEPTTHLDMASVAHLTEALRAYQGAFIVVSHDRPFLDDLALTSRLDLGQLATPKPCSTPGG